MLIPLKRIKIRLRLLNKMIISKAMLVLMAIFLLFSVTTSVFSQSPTSLSFPVDELGGCTNLEGCTNYCEDPVNYNSCSNFAKKNGFYRDDVTTHATDELWQDAKKELGCDSQDGCTNFCSQPANFDACSAYAKSNKLPGGYTDEPDKP